MTVSKQDFEVAAAVIRRKDPAYRRMLAEVFAEFFRLESRRFDQERFLKARDLPPPEVYPFGLEPELSNMRRTVR